MGAWEYRVLAVHASHGNLSVRNDRGEEAPLEAILNELGAERWEVVAVTPSATTYLLYTLKRPKRGAGSTH
jgi:hypothetical protein